MALIPEDFIQQVLERVDIIDIVGAKVDLKKRGASYLGLCPFHGEKTPSFNVNQQKQFYHCFGCGAGGNALKFLLEYDKMNFPDAVRMLADKVGMQMPTAQAGSGTQYKPLYDATARASGWFASQLESKAGQPAMNYLKERALTKETIEAYDLGFAPAGWSELLTQLSQDTEVQHLVTTGLVVEKSPDKRFDRFRHRVIFPIRQVSGRVIAFGARVLDPQDQPKYLNSPDTPIFQKGRHLYGLYEAVADRNLQRLLFVEGYMDVLALAQAGITGAVACMGTTVTPTQMTLAFRYTKELVFCFDGDDAGRRAAIRTLTSILPILADDYQARFMFLPQGADPDSLVREGGAQAFLDLLEEAVNASDFLLTHLQREVDMTSIEGRAQMAVRAEQMLALVKGQHLRALLVQSVRSLTGLNDFNVQPAEEARPPDAQQRPVSPAFTDRLAMTSPVHSTLQCLLMAPKAGASLAKEDRSWLTTLADPDTALLDRVLRKLDAQPTDNSAGLIAQFTGEDDYKHLLALYESAGLLLISGDWPEALHSNWAGLQKRAQKLKSTQAVADFKKCPSEGQLEAIIDGKRRLHKSRSQKAKL